ncbi:hypothetical protein P885DRAFT_43437 [Corynascus similis CBS 632.67]
MWTSSRVAGAFLWLWLLAFSYGVAAADVGSISPTEGFAMLPKCNSTCEVTDAKCLCTDVQFNNDATTCITSICTVRQSLVAKNVTEHMCGRGPEGDGSLIPVYLIFIGLAVVAVALRLIARVLTQAYFWWDDFANLFAFLFFVDMLLYTVTRFFVRTSVILFYLRVFPPKPDNKLGRILQYTLAFNVIYNVSFLFAVAFQCTPVEDFWRQWEGNHEGHCGNANILVWVAAATGIAYDVWLLALPFPQLMALNVHWKKKVMGSIMFADIVQVCLWSGIELDVGVICPCLPSLRLLLRRLLPRVLGSTGRYELDPMSTAATAGGMRSGIRRSIGGGQVGGGHGAPGGAGKIVVENTFAVKYGSSGDLDDSETRSSASVRGLVQGRLSAGDEESRPGGGEGMRRN